MLFRRILVPCAIAALALTAAADAKMPLATSSRPLVYVVDKTYANTIDVYQVGQTSPNPTATISAGVNHPLGLGTDAKGNLYVNNIGTSPPSMSVYAPGASAPFKMLNYPAPTGNVNVYVGPNGALYLSGIKNNQFSEYVNGDSKPIRTFEVPDGVLIPEIADEHNNVYALRETKAAAAGLPALWDVVVFPRGTSQYASIFNAVDRYAPSALAFLPNRDLLLFDQMTFGEYGIGQRQDPPRRLFVDPLLVLYQIAYAAVTSDGNVIVQFNVSGPRNSTFMAEFDGRTGAVLWKLEMFGYAQFLAVSPIARF